MCSNECPKKNVNPNVLFMNVQLQRLTMLDQHDSFLSPVAINLGILTHQERALGTRLGGSLFNLYTLEFKTRYTKYI